MTHVRFSACTDRRPVLVVILETHNFVSNNSCIIYPCPLYSIIRASIPHSLKTYRHPTASESYQSLEEHNQSAIQGMSTQPLLQRTAKKRIALPVRVEPKVFFANERTFLSWLHFAVVLGGLAVGLLNFGDKVGKISAAMYTIIAMGVMLYALVIYQMRARAIRLRTGAPYDDRLGPVSSSSFIQGPFCHCYPAFEAREGFQ
ncbi:vacuolar transporter chaperone 1 [Cryptococcus neoformans]|nr:vacuolar transporter chaperone 1 [Cryptococcus neoformans var. grubii]